MDGRLVMVVAMVAVACLTLGAKAQNVSVSTNNTSATTVSTNGTSSTTVSTNGTSATTVSTNGTSATTVSTNGTSSTTVSTNGTSATTVSLAVTNATTVPATAGPTTIQTTTPFVSDNTVETLTSNITRDSCGKTQFCASEPSTCDPSSESCFFVSAAQSSGQVFSFELNGPSTGYVAMGLATSASQTSNVTTYVCANSNGTFKFFTTFLNNKEFVMTSLPVNNVKGVVRGELLQCAFTASLPKASVSSKSADTRFFISLSNGNFTNGTLDTPTDQLRSAEAVDLSNPNSTFTNSLTATAAPPSSHGITLQRSLSQALLILLGVLGLALL